MVAGNTNEEQRDLKAIKRLQDGATDLETQHSKIAKDIHEVKQRLRSLVPIDPASASFAESLRVQKETMAARAQPLRTNVEELYREAETVYPGIITPDDLLTETDWKVTNARIVRHVDEFNARFGLDQWDYAIAGSCGLFAAMLDLLCVRAPTKPTAKWTTKVDGVFNRIVQKAFNTVLPPELSAELATANKIGSADASTVTRLLGASPGTLNPINHRLRSLSHDPVLGLLFGVADMMRGTCTVVGNNGVKVFQGQNGPAATGVVGALAKMLGHLASDVNAPSSKGNRGMGLPAPFMGILRMFNNIPVGESNLGKQVEYMYVKGYDFRQFAATSIPALIMEVLMRACYAAKQVKLVGEPLGQALIQTVPTRMNPRFRTMLAIGYGCMAGVNAGRVYVSQDVMNLNYAAWMGLVWNGFHAMKWALLDKHLQLWDGIEREEIAALERMVGRIEELESRVERLPT